MAAPHQSGPQVYHIRVRGRLGQTMRSAFPALRARTDGGDTVLTGVLPDQAALYGVVRAGNQADCPLRPWSRTAWVRPDGMSV